MLDSLAARRPRVVLLAPAPVEQPRAGVERVVGVSLHRALDDGAESGAQAPRLGIAQRGRPPAGIDPGLEQHLVRDPVADSSSERLVEEQRFEDAPALPHQLREPCRRRHREQRVEAELRDGRLVLGILAQEDTPQPASVRHRQLAAVVQVQPNLHEARRPHRRVLARSRLQLQRRGGGRLEAARHPEVEQRMRRRVQLQPELLAPAPYRGDPLAFERAAPVIRSDPVENDRIVVAPRPLDAASDRHRFGELASPFNLRQLRHASS